MSLIDLIKKEDDKYIIVSDFINLVANHTNDTSDIVIEYLCKFCLVDNDDVRIYIKGFANDYSNEFHLSDLIFKDDKKDDFRCYTMSELEKDDEFLISYFLRDEIFNAKYIKVLNLKTDNDKLKATDSYKINAPKTRVVLGEYQKLLITYSLFTPRQLACLIADYNPAYHHNDDFYNACLDMVNNAIEAKLLTLINDKKQIEAEEAQLWLMKCGLIYKGFNSDLRYETLETYQAEHSNQQLIVDETSKGINQELTAANAKIKALESELKKANAALADAPAHDSILQTILDESHEHHAPDLSYSIKLWSDLYIDGQIGTDSHSNKANLWINNNTSYGNNTINSSVKRLREVSTPLKDFGGLRSKEIKK